MHDGRFQTLEAVLDHYNSEDIFYSSNVDPQIQLASNQKFGTSLKLTPEEKQAIIAFLHTLTDSTALKFVP
jgi:cytochrome c peroxidase